MVAAWRKSKTEEKKSLLSSRHGSSSRNSTKKKSSNFLTGKFPKTPPVTPADDDDDDNDLRYDVAIVASEYDPSQSFGLSGPKPMTRYPSTPMRRVEFKPDMAPPIFTPPPPLTEESVMMKMAQEKNLMESMPPQEPTSEQLPQPQPLPGKLSLYGQTLKLIDDICQIPSPQERDLATAGTRDWGTAPSGDDGSTDGPSYVNSTVTETDAYTEYSKGYTATTTPPPENNLSSSAAQPQQQRRQQQRLESMEELIEHENYEVVLDVATLGAGGTSSTPPRRRNSRNVIKAESKRSMVKRLFSSRKNEDGTDGKKDDTEAPENNNEAKLPSGSSAYDTPEVHDEADVSIMNVDKLADSHMPADPPANHVRDIAVTLVPPTCEQRTLSPVEEILNSIGTLFSYYNEDEKKGDPEGKRVEPEFSIAATSFVEEYEEEYGPEDEVEENLTPSPSFADSDERSVHASIGVHTPATAATVQTKEKEKGRRGLSLGILGKRLSKSKSSKKKVESLWLPAVDSKGRTYWYNSKSRQSTYLPPPLAPKREVEDDGLLKSESTKAVVVEKPTIPEATTTKTRTTEVKDAPPTRGVFAKMGKPLSMKKKEKSSSSVVAAPKKNVNQTEEGKTQVTPEADTTPKKKNSTKEKPLWASAVDPKTGRKYWYNRITRESTYDPPPGIIDSTPLVEPEVKTEAVTAEKEDLEPLSLVGARTISNLSKQQSVSEQPLDEPQQTKSHREKSFWATAVEPKSGRTYWYNLITRVSTYDPPHEAFGDSYGADESVLEKPLPKQAESVSATPEATKTESNELQDKSKEESMRRVRSKLSTSASREETPEGSNETTKEKKPLWMTAVNAKNGRTYWYNRITRESTYDPPPEALAQKTTEEEDATPKKMVEAKVELKQAEAATEANKKETTEMGASNVTSEGDADAPKKKSKKPMWKAVVDPKSGKTYYYHRKTAETTWKMPKELKDLEEAQNSAPTETDKATTADRDAALQSGSKIPPLVVQAEVSEESTARIMKGEQGLLDRSYEREDDAEAQDVFDMVGVEDENPFDEPIVNVGDIQMPRATSASRSTTFVSRASATTKSSAKTERIRNTGPINSSKAIETISETMSTATSISSQNDEMRLSGSTPERPTSIVRSRELKVEDLSGSRVAAETYDRAGRVLYGKASTEDEGSDYGDNGDDSVSALSENDVDLSQRKENFEQARRRALDDAIDREDWDLAAALSEGMRATTSTGEYTKAHKSWNQSELDKFIAANDWDAVKSYIAHMREAKKADREEFPPPLRKTSSAASEPTIRVATSSRTMSSPPTIPESPSFPYEKRIGSRSQAQHERIQKNEANQRRSSAGNSSSSDDSTDLSRSIDEETYDSESS